MMMNKKKPFSLHLDVDSFMPATAEEKEVISRMRPSSTFFRDGVKRLLKNKVATISLILIVLITLSSIIIPMFWPYSYDQMLGQTKGRPMDNSYNNLAPFQYGKTELKKIDKGNLFSRTSSARTRTDATTSSASSTGHAFPSPLASSPASSCW